MSAAGPLALSAAAITALAAVVFLVLQQLTVAVASLSLLRCQLYSSMQLFQIMMLPAAQQPRLSLQYHSAWALAAPWVQHSVAACGSRLPTHMLHQHVVVTHRDVNKVQPASSQQVILACLIWHIKDNFAGLGTAADSETTTL